MLTFILLGTIAVVCFLAAFFLDKKLSNSYDFDWVPSCFIGISIATVLATIITATSLINVKTRFEEVENKYEAIVSMAESYDGKDYGNMTSLSESIVDINKTIAKHKAHYKSIWTGPWYSKDIANLPTITFERKTVQEE